MAEIKLREYADVTSGQHFRRKVKVQTGEDEHGKPIIADEYEYVLANQFFGDPGFTVRQPATAGPDGTIYPPSVTGGGNSDYMVKDLLTGRISVVRGVDFARLYERVSPARLPKPLKEKVSEADALDVEA